MDFIALFYKEPTAIEMGHRVGGKRHLLYGMLNVYTQGLGSLE